MWRIIYESHTVLPLVDSGSVMGPVAQPASDSKMASETHRNGSFVNKMLSLGFFSYFEVERIPKTGAKKL